MTRRVRLALKRWKPDRFTLSLLLASAALVKGATMLFGANGPAVLACGVVVVFAVGSAVLRIRAGAADRRQRRWPLEPDTRMQELWEREEGRRAHVRRRPMTRL